MLSIQVPLSVLRFKAIENPTLLLNERQQADPRVYASKKLGMQRLHQQPPRYRDQPKAKDHSRGDRERRNPRAIRNGRRACEGSEARPDLGGGSFRQERRRK